MRNLDNHLNLETGTERDLGRAKASAGMYAALAKYFAKKFGGAIGDRVRFGEVGSAVHDYRHLDDTLHLAQVAKGRLERGKEFYGDVTRSLPSAIVIC